MDKVPWLEAQGLTSWDLNNIPKDAQKGFGWLVGFLLGSNQTCVDGFAASQSIVPNMSINVTEGWIYKRAPVDAAPIGAFPSDQMEIFQQGYTPAQTVALDSSDLNPGESKWWLIQVEFEQRQVVRTGDPTDGRRPFYNSANPPVPLNGPNGLGGSIPTVVNSFAKVTKLEGAPATEPIPPTPSSNCVPLFLVKVSYGQVAIVNGDIHVAGDNAYPEYPDAPFIAGLLNTHHKGLPGHAPKIDLTSEVQNKLPLANTTASNTTGILSCLRFGAIDPNGNLAGQLYDTYFDTISITFYLCTSAGPASGSGQAVWTPLGLTAKFQLVNTSPYTVADQFVTLFVDSSEGPMVVKLPSGLNPGKVTVRNIGNPFNRISVQPDVGGQLVEGAASHVIEGPDSRSFETETTNGNWWIV